MAKILSGANPAELAMSPPQQIELVLHLQAAESIGYVFRTGQALPLKANGCTG